MDIYEQWGKTVKDVISRYAKTQSKENKEDFEQDCFVHLLEKQHYIEKMAEESDTKAKHYVYGLCHNFILNLIRNIGKRNNTDPLQEAHNLKSEDFHGFGVSEQDLDVAVKLLPKLEQKIVRDLFFSSKTEKDVGASFDRSQNWVRTRKERAIQQLREILENRK